MNNKVLFIGNGINDIENEYSWEDLIKSLIKFVNGEGLIVYDKKKPFPLMYEEIFVRAYEIGISEPDLKNFISKDVDKLPITDIHRTIVKKDVQDIITSNYDFTLEKALMNNNISSLKNQGVVDETLYSIFRRYDIKDKTLWHMHGDSMNPKTLNLGYEHYSGYLQQMRNYVVTPGTYYKNFKKDPLVKRLKNGGEIEIESWIDHFFLNDIYFIGLTLDFIEIDLWWLLTSRRRSKPVKNVTVDNHIIYFYPDILKQEIKHKLQLLGSLNIKTIPCEYDKDNKLPYYQEVLRKVDQNIQELIN